MTTRYRFRFHGRVQGVGFRFTAESAARTYGLTGWVKNEYDDTVLMEIQGSRLKIYALLSTLKGDRYIRIDSIDREEIPVEPREKRFAVIGL